MKPVAILASGMMTGVGLSSAATCAAMRANLSAFDETRFMNTDGEWIVGSQVPLDKPWRGTTKLVRLASSAIQECLAYDKSLKSESLPLLLCIAEKERPGRLEGLDDLLPLVQDYMGVKFHPKSACIASGKVGGAVALDTARQLLYEQGVPGCIIAGVDSFLVGTTLNSYEAKHRLLTGKNSNGFIPGEAGAAVLVALPASKGPKQLQCLALGFGKEPATFDSEHPLRADGLVEAYRALKQDGGVTLDDTDYRYTDCNGEQYGFKDDRLAFSRVVRKLKARFDHLHPADSVGEIGAAVGPCILGLALAAAQKNYAPGVGVLCHLSSDSGERAAMILRYGEKGSVS
jgi:3-oxoacyl-[acyl-carrier-protein] synthase I